MTTGGQKRIPSREGGVEVVVEELATRMAQQGHSVTCYNRGGHHVSGSAFDAEAVSKYKGVRLKTVPTIEYLKYRKQLDSTSVRVSLYAIFVQIWFVIYGYSGNGIYDANEFFFYIMAIAMMIAVVQESKNLTC